MNDHHDEASIEDEQQKLDAKRLLEARIAHNLQTQAAHIHFTNGLRNRILQNIPTQHKAAHHRRFLAPALALAVILLIVFSLGTYLLLAQQPSIQYALNQVVAVPAELAQGGQLLSLDPTGQHLVYQPAAQPGVMYTADISDPLASNVLAMRYAHDVGWSPDGTELVTTVSPQGVTTPLLALVRVGQYMKPLGPDAEAASWSPTSRQQILYITQAGGHTQLWAIPSSGTGAVVQARPPSGQTAHAQLIASMNIALPVQHIVWSYDGQKLALLTTAGQHTGNALYVMDAHTHTLSTIIKAGTVTIENVGWSPDKHYLTYEQIDRQGHDTLHAINIDQPKELFALSLQKKLTGYSWSPDSNAIVYSDGGILHTYTLHGMKIQLPVIAAVQYSPFWLKDGRILYLNIANGEGKLAILAQSKQ